MGITVSATSLFAAPRPAVSKAQAELGRAEQEAASGRHADAGLTLGDRTGKAVELRATSSAITRQTETNKLIDARLDLTETALKTIADGADSFLATLTGAANTATSTGALVDAAKSTLALVLSALNSSDGSTYLFSGASIDRPAMALTGSTGNAYAGSNAEAGVVASFTAAFGIAPGADGSSAITPEAMSAFIAGDFEALFSDAAFARDWSQADSAVISNVIGGDERVAVSQSANAQAFRDVIKAAVMVISLGTTELGDSARQTVVAAARETLGKGSAAITQLRSDVGASSARIEAANTRLKLQQGIVDEQVSQMESVDPYELSLRIDLLTERLEASYKLTVRLKELSLLKYL